MNRNGNNRNKVMFIFLHEVKDLIGFLYLYFIQKCIKMFPEYYVKKFK